MPTINPIIKRAGNTQPDDNVYLNPPGATTELEVPASAVAAERKKISRGGYLCVHVWEYMCVFVTINRVS